MTPEAERLVDRAMTCFVDGPTEIESARAALVAHIQTLEHECAKQRQRADANVFEMDSQARRSGEAIARLGLRMRELGSGK